MVNDHVYHVFNRSLRNLPIFTSKTDVSYFLSAIGYYLQIDTPIKFSIFRKQPNNYRSDPSQSAKWTEILAYCVMPDHFHLLMKQRAEKGVQIFMHRITNSYAHYYNQRHEQKGPIFEGKFKAVMVSTEYQLTHVSRYIHLNPVTSLLCNKPEDYEYSSYKTFLGLPHSFGNFVNPDLILAHFQSPKIYQEFVMDQKDYQKELRYLRHLILEKG